MILEGFSSQDSCLRQHSSEASCMAPAGYTALTGFEQPLAPSTKLRELSYISNFQTAGDVPAFLGGLASLEKLDLSNNNFNGSIPGDAHCGTLISVCGFGVSGKPRAACDSHHVQPYRLCDKLGLYGERASTQGA